MTTQKIIDELKEKVQKEVIKLFEEQVLSGFVRNEIWNRELLLIGWTFDTTISKINNEHKKDVEEMKDENIRLHKQWKKMYDSTERLEEIYNNYIETIEENKELKQKISEIDIEHKKEVEELESKLDLVTNKASCADSIIQMLRKEVKKLEQQQQNANKRIEQYKDKFKDVNTLIEAKDKKIKELYNWIDIERCIDNTYRDLDMGKTIPIFIQRLKEQLKQKHTQGK